LVVLINCRFNHRQSKGLKASVAGACKFRGAALSNSFLTLQCDKQHS